MMKKEYEAPEMKITKFGTEDCITTSNNTFSIDPDKDDTWSYPTE